MSAGILHKIGSLAQLESSGWMSNPSLSDEQPTLQDLVLPGSSNRFSEEFACLLRLLSGYEPSPKD
jgi:hypothetical protein